jgi:hypothetical protein
MNWFWHAMWIAFVIIPLSILWIFCVVDIFVRRDLSGLARVAWLLAVLVLPLVGALLYLIARPRSSETVIDTRTPAAGTDGLSVADEVAKLDPLRKEGVLSEAEFSAQKGYLLDLPSQRSASTQPAGR